MSFPVFGSRVDMFRLSDRRFAAVGDQYRAPVRGSRLFDPRDGETDRDVKLVGRQFAGQLRLTLPVHDPLPLMRVIGEVEHDDLVEDPQAARQRLAGRAEQAGESCVRQDLAEPQQRRDRYDHVAQLIRANNATFLILPGKECVEARWMMLGRALICSTTTAGNPCRAAE